MIISGAKDLAGNELTYPFTWNFIAEPVSVTPNPSPASTPTATPLFIYK